MAAIQIEFFGIPRQRAGVESATVEIDGTRASLGDVVERVASQFPTLAQECFDGRRLLPGFSANIDGNRFVTDPQTLLRDGSSLLIMSADAGG